MINYPLIYLNENTSNSITLLEENLLNPFNWNKISKEEIQKAFDFISKERNKLLK